MCPVAPFVKDLSVNISVFTLTFIAIDRWSFRSPYSISNSYIGNIYNYQWNYILYA
jgi:hypothetical protein